MYRYDGIAEMRVWEVEGGYAYAPFDFAGTELALPKISTDADARAWAETLAKWRAYDLEQASATEPGELLSAAQQRTIKRLSRPFNLSAETHKEALRNARAMAEEDGRMNGVPVMLLVPSTKRKAEHWKAIWQVPRPPTPREILRERSNVPSTPRARPEVGTPGPWSPDRLLAASLANVARLEAAIEAERESFQAFKDGQAKTLEVREAACEARCNELGRELQKALERAADLAEGRADSVKDYQLSAAIEADTKPLNRQDEKCHRADLISELSDNDLLPRADGYELFKVYADEKWDYLLYRRLRPSPPRRLEELREGVRLGLRAMRDGALDHAAPSTESWDAPLKETARLNAEGLLRHAADRKPPSSRPRQTPPHWGDGAWLKNFPHPQRAAPKHDVHRTPDSPPPARDESTPVVMSDRPPKLE